MVKTYANVEELLAIVNEVERVLRELGETPFEPLKEEHEKNMHNDTMLEKQVIVLNGSFINFIKGSSSSVGAIPSGISSIVC